MLSPGDSRRDRLRSQVTAHAPADRRESDHRERMLALAAAPGDVFSRHHFVPGHFTASAFVLSPDEEALLLIFHRRLERWLQPGGHFDFGDGDVAAAARREVLEETGIAAYEVGGGRGARGRGELLDLDIHFIPAQGDEPAHEHFDVRVLMRAQSVELRAGLDVHDARWVPLTAVAGVMTDESVKRVAAKLAGRRAHCGGRG